MHLAVGSFLLLTTSSRALSLSSPDIHQYRTDQMVQMLCEMPSVSICLILCLTPIPQHTRQTPFFETVSVLPRLLSNSWDQVIISPQLSECLEGHTQHRLMNCHDSTPYNTSLRRWRQDNFKFGASLSCVRPCSQTTKSRFYIFGKKAILNVSVSCCCWHSWLR